MSEKNKKPTGKKENSSVSFVQKIRGSKKACTGIVVVAAVLLLFFGFAVYSAAYDDIFPGVSVNGVDVGGMSVDEATEKLQNDLVPVLTDRTLELKCEDNSKTVSVSDLCPDGVDASILAKQAHEIGREEGAFAKAIALVSAIFGETDVAAELNIDEKAFSDIILEISGEHSTPVVETGYELNGDTLTIIKGNGGRCVIMEKAVKQVNEALADADVSEVVFVIEDAEPKPVDVDEFYANLTKPAQDAAYKREDGDVIVVDEVYGIIVDKDVIEKALESAEKTVDVKVKTTKPSKTAAELKSLLFRDVMGEWSSNYATSTSARANNVELAARRMNGTVLMPGEVFSYDNTIGARTSANGYQSAGVYVGNKVESGIGGGICQPSSTLYGAVLYANLEIVTRTSHSLPVSYVPAGQDATIAQGYIDFKFKNNTDYPIKIVATYGGRNLTCKILGVKPAGQTVEISHVTTGYLSSKVTKVADASIPQGYKKTGDAGKGGYTVASRRIVKVNGKEVKNEKLTNSVYNATDTEVSVNPADMEASVDALIEYTGQPVPESSSKGTVTSVPGTMVPIETPIFNETQPSGEAPETEAAPAPEATDAPTAQPDAAPSAEDAPQSAVE